MNWSYGILTVPQRLADGLLQRTITSLAGAGFEKPRLFVDGCADASGYERFGLPLTVREPRVQTFSNWLLSLWELYTRDVDADRFVIFEDDLVTYKNLRQYLEQTEYSKESYLNLYTFPANQQLCPNGREGWYISNQRGLGAVALVFNQEAAKLILTSPHMIAHLSNPIKRGRRHRSVDGGIVTAFKQAGWKEQVHNPSLVQHTGVITSMGNRKHPEAPSFRGEDFDALSLLNKEQT